jgi:hypothetical protein
VTTTEEQLAKLEAAIDAIQGGAQEYSIGSRRVKRADYSVLCKEYRLLKQQQVQETSGDTFVAVFDRR